MRYNTLRRGLSGGQVRKRPSVTETKARRVTDILSDIIKRKERKNMVKRSPSDKKNPRKKRTTTMSTVRVD